MWKTIDILYNAGMDDVPDITPLDADSAKIKITYAAKGKQHKFYIDGLIIVVGKEWIAF